MATTKSLVWKGEAVTERIRAAQIAGVNTIMARCSQHAKLNHPWENQTTQLETAIGLRTPAAPVADGVRGTWGVADQNQARILELGGTIVPKRSKFLTIPISPEARISGGARKMSNLTYARSQDGEPQLIDAKTGKVHWLLRKSVTIKAQPYLRPAGDVHYPSLGKAIRAAYDKSAPATGGGDA